MKLRIFRKIFGKKGLSISYILMIASFAFFIYVVLQSPYAHKIPYLGNQIYAWQLSRQAQKFPADSLERARFEAMAQAVKNGQKDYVYTAPPNASQMLSGQK